MSDILGGLLFLALGGGMAAYCVVKGEIPGNIGMATFVIRDEAPLSFWFYVGLYGFGGLLGIYLIAKGLGF